MLKNISSLLILMAAVTGLYAQPAGETDNTGLTAQKEASQKQISEYRRQLSERPDDIELNRGYQNFIRQQGGLNDLKEEYLLRLNGEPGNPRYYYFYGRLAEGNELEDAFKKGLELEAKTPDQELRFWLYFGLGQFYLDGKKHKESLRHLEQASELRPDSIEALHQQALVHYETENINDALHLWDKILGIKQYHLDAFLGKALIYKSRGMFDHAIKELESILKINAAFWRAYEPLIQCHHAKHDYKKGAELRNKMRSLNAQSGKPPIIIIDIIQVKNGFCIVKENIEMSGVALEEHVLFNFEIYRSKSDKKPGVFYDYESRKGILFRREKEKADKEGLLTKSPKEIVSEKKLNYPELVKLVLEGEK